MKRILGLDLGTNSIGWALVKHDFNKKNGSIEGMGSRIIPMAQDLKDEFGKGNSVSQTADRTRFRSIRRLRERHLLRRERLHRVLNTMGFLPKHYADQIDFTTRPGKFFADKEPKIAYDGNGFIFKSAFDEMLDDFRRQQPELVSHGKKIPHDWTIYYLRKKALTQKVAKEELAWIILNFNQKRGYYQLRGEEVEEDKNQQFLVLRIEKAVDSGEKVGGKILYEIYFDNGWKYDKLTTKPEDWIGRTKEFIVSESIRKSGEIKRTFKSVDSEKDWVAIKAKTQKDIDRSRKTVGAYIYDNLLQDPHQKIRGRLVRTIERQYYRVELDQIIRKQTELQPAIFSDELFHECIRELYRNNDAHRNSLSKKDFAHLFINDIIFYQRPLRSQKSSVSKCPLEFRKYRNNEGDETIANLKAIPKSNPYYQEFRIWQWLYNLKIYERENDVDVTSKFIRHQIDIVNLFDFLSSQKEVNHVDVLSHLILPQIKARYPDAKPKALKTELLKEMERYRWNYVFDESKPKEEEKSKTYPMNETGHEIRKRLAKVEDLTPHFVTDKIEYALWHLIYSVTDKLEYEKALKKFASRYGMDESSFLASFKNYPPFPGEYGSFSEKAIKKLLPLMRIGKYWNLDNVDGDTRGRMADIINGVDNDDIRLIVREKASKHKLETESEFQGLPLWLAQYVVYNRHAEADVSGKWTSVADMEAYLDGFKQHSLRNPIVEQVITETLRVVRDIWKHFGNGRANFFDEIHIELGREMKSPAEDRKRMTNQISENENTNLRIKALLAELLEDGSVQNVRPFSPMQQEALKIYEDGALAAAEEIPDDIQKISRTAQPSKADLNRYKLWLEQRYCSPYTGQTIPLSKLFTPEYEIEHIIPQSRYFDDSFSNKIICESAVNKLKDKQLGLEFIKNHHGTTVDIGFGKTVKVFTEDAYKQYVQERYSKNRSKREKLLLEEIPEKMIERQLNDTRYISKFISNNLSNLVRQDENDEGVNSKNLIHVNGKITSVLRQDWGLNDVWNDLILPRFQRMNQLTQSTDFTAWNERHQKFLPTVPLELSKGFSKKRIDHRHHALDALVIACATRDHVNLLNNKFAKSPERFDLNRKLRRFETKQYIDPLSKDPRVKDVPADFLKPWNSLPVEAKNALEKIIVSFKQNIRIINKTSNKYQKYVDKNGQKTKEQVPQTKGDNWAIRKPMHKDTVYGLVKLSRIKTPKEKILTATRKNIDTSFHLKRIESITDTGIQKILKSYLKSKGDNPEIAFTPEGLEEMNENIERFNDGKKHKPIYKARVFEMGSRFPLGQTGNKKDKYVEAAKGTNLFFAVYQEGDKRSFDTIPLNIVIERLKQGLGAVPETDEKGNTLLFYLSPNDLVYLPKEREMPGFEAPGSEGVRDIFKVVNFTGNRLYVIPVNVASVIVNKIEFSQLNKIEWTKEKEYMQKLNVDRLGKPAGTEKLISVVDEPGATYKKNIGGSPKVFEVTNELDAEAAAQIPPLQLLQNTTELIKKIHRDKLAEPSDKILKFKK